MGDVLLPLLISALLFLLLLAVRLVRPSLRGARGMTFALVLSGAAVLVSAAFRLWPAEPQRATKNAPPRLPRSQDSGASHGDASRPDPLLETSLKAGRPHGRWRRRSAEGKLLLEGFFTTSHGKTRKSGRWTRYRSDGTKAWACTFADGLVDGWLPACIDVGPLPNSPCRDLSPSCDVRAQLVVPRKPIVRGGLRPRQVAAPVYRQLFELSACRLIVEGPKPMKLGGHVTFRLSIAPNGKLDALELLRSELQTRGEVEDCMSKALRRLTFPKAARASSVRYTFWLSRRASLARDLAK